MPFTQTTDPSAIPFKSVDGLTVLSTAYPEPGLPLDGSLGGNDRTHCCYPQIVQITDLRLTGTEPLTGDCVLTITPISGPAGSAWARGMPAASITFAASNQDHEACVSGLVAKASSAGSISSPQTSYDYSRVNAYVALSVSPTGNDYLRITGREIGGTFEYSLTLPSGTTYSATVVQSPSTTQLIVGGFCAVDTTKGSNGYLMPSGQLYVTAITSATDPDNIVGPIGLGEQIEPSQVGDNYRYFLPGSMLDVFNDGVHTAFGEGAIANSSMGQAVYVRHTASGSLKPGMVGDLADAAAGATRDKWTGTPTAVDSTEYLFQILFEGERKQYVVLGDGSATATEICDAARVEITKDIGTGKWLEGFTLSGTSTLIIEGPTDGRTFTPSQIAASAGTIGWAHTTTGVSTHHLTTHKFRGPSAAFGSVPVQAGT